ncbi:MAG: DNA-directed RNA polymerase specialized sigma24 family protein [Planctomycetota bacterium]|jgi:DNA-directed RNA polymerase specialized sigma24 family protein
MNSAHEPVPTEQLFVHAQWVRRLAIRLVNDPNLADDVVQDTWVAAMEKPPRGDVGTLSVKAWLAKVVHN